MEILRDRSGKISFGRITSSIVVFVILGLITGLSGTIIYGLLTGATHIIGAAGPVAGLIGTLGGSATILSAVLYGGSKLSDKSMAKQEPTVTPKSTRTAKAPTSKA